MRNDSENLKKKKINRKGNRKKASKKRGSNIKRDDKD